MPQAPGYAIRWAWEAGDTLLRLSVWTDKQVETPEIGDDDVLVRVHAASVCKGDVHLLTGKPYLVRLGFGLRRPKRRIAGQNVAGTVEAVGRNVTTMRPGDEVYGQVTCGLPNTCVRVPTSSRRSRRSDRAAVHAP